MIENEYMPADGVEEEARVRLGESLDAEISRGSGNVNSVIALRSPISLRDCAGQDAVDILLSQGAPLEYALFTGPNPSDAKRFPKSGFIRGGIRDLAAFTVYASVPEHLVEEAVDILKAGVYATAHQLRWCVEESDTTLPEINHILKQPYVEETLRMEKTSREEQTLRMAATVMINALIFHENLAGQHGIKDLDSLTDKYGLLLRSTVLEEWRKILKINYWSIFNVAREILRNITPPEAAYHVLREMRYATDKIMSLGVSRSHDLTGTVFQRLIADRKFLATYYTRPESAALLAHLAIPDGDQWADPERVKDFRIADYACGTGTLIHAAYRRLNQLHWIAGGQPDKLHAYMMEHSLTACDVLPSAVHLTASMLSSSHPRQGYERTRTIVTQYGKTENGDASHVSLGSLDLLANNGGIRPLIPLHTGVAVTGKGEEQSLLDDIDMPPASQDLVIMNPPFTASGFRLGRRDTGVRFVQAVPGTQYGLGYSDQDVGLGEKVHQRHLRTRICRHCIVLCSPGRPHGQGLWDHCFGPSYDIAARFKLGESAPDDRRRLSGRDGADHRLASAAQPVVLGGNRYGRDYASMPQVI